MTDMNTHYRTPLKGAIVGLLLIAVALGGPLGTVSAQSGPVVSVGDETVDTGGTTTVEVTLSEAPEGVAGFKIVVSVADTATATITAVSVPESWGITDTSVSENEATLEGIDVDENVQPGATDITLGTVTLEGEADGETGLTVDIVDFDDDDGNGIEPATEAGTLTVTGTEAGTETATSSGNDDDGSGSGSNDDGGSSSGPSGDDSGADAGDTDASGSSGTDSSDAGGTNGSESTPSDGADDTSSDGDSESTTTGTAVRDDGSSITSSDSDDSTATTEPTDASNSTLGGDTEQSMLGGLPIQGGLGMWVGLVALLLFATGIGVVTVRRNRHGGPAASGPSTTDAGQDATATGTTPSDAAEALSAVGDELSDLGITVLDLQAGQSGNTLSYATAAANHNAAKVEIRTIVRAYAAAADGPLGHERLEATICRDDETLGTWHIRGDWLAQLDDGSLSMEALDEKVFETLSRTS